MELDTKQIFRDAKSSFKNIKLLGGIGGLLKKIYFLGFSIIALFIFLIIVFLEVVSLTKLELISLITPSNVKFYIMIGFAIFISVFLWHMLLQVVFNKYLLDSIGGLEIGFRSTYKEMKENGLRNVFFVVFVKNIVVHLYKYIVLDIYIGVFTVQYHIDPLSLITAFFMLIFLLPVLMLVRLICSPYIYNYYLVDFIMADRHDLSRQEAFLMSKKMIYGYRKKIFFIDLLFIGVLAFITFVVPIVLIVPPIYPITIIFMKVVRVHIYLTLRDNALSTGLVQYEDLNLYDDTEEITDTHRSENKYTSPNFIYEFPVEDDEK